MTNYRLEGPIRPIVFSGLLAYGFSKPVAVHAIVQRELETTYFRSPLLIIVDKGVVEAVRQNAQAGPGLGRISALSFSAFVSYNAIPSSLQFIPFDYKSPILLF